MLQTIDPATLATLNEEPGQPGRTGARRLRALRSSGRIGREGRDAECDLPAAARYRRSTLRRHEVALARAPTNARALGVAVGEIALKLRVAPAQAAARLQALGKVPVADLAFLALNGPKVQHAAAQLKSVSTVPPSDLAYLQAHAAKVAKARHDNPGQWQTWWWVCFCGQLLFIPLMLLLTGHWSPRKAREDELEHAQMVERELARLDREQNSIAAASAVS